MCAIVDTNVVNSSILGSASDAGRKFLEYVSLGAVKLVIGGGRLRNEIRGCNREFQRWLSTAKKSNFALDIGDHEVDAEEKKLVNSKICASDDEHLVALATVTGATLIFTNDRDLQQDCKSLLDRQPKIYTTNDDRTRFTSDKQRLLTDAVCTRTN